MRAVRIATAVCIALLCTSLIVDKYTNVLTTAMKESQKSRNWNIFQQLIAFVNKNLMTKAKEGRERGRESEILNIRHRLHFKYNVSQPIRCKSLSSYSIEDINCKSEYECFQILFFFIMFFVLRLHLTIN